MKKMNVTTIISGLISIIAGVALMLLRGSVLTPVITVLGIGFIVTGLLPGIKHLNKFSVVKIILGICLIIFGNTFINLSMYIIGIALIVLGAFRFSFIKSLFKRVGRLPYSMFIPALLTAAAGVCILLNPTGSVETLFYVCGILLIAGGAYDLWLCVKVRS